MPGGVGGDAQRRLRLLLTLKHMQLQLDNIETELNLAIVTRHAELTACSTANPHASCRQQHDR